MKTEISKSLYELLQEKEAGLSIEKISEIHESTRNKKIKKFKKHHHERHHSQAPNPDNKENTIGKSKMSQITKFLFLCLSVFSK